MMKNPLSSLALLATVAASTHAQAAPDPFSDPAAAVEARVGVHRLMAANMADAAAIATGQKAFDGYALLARAKAISGLSEMSRDFFLVPGSLANSNAKASIPAQLDDYKDKERALVIAAFGFRTAVNNRDPKASKPALINVVKACDSCHADYMNKPLLFGAALNNAEH